MVLGRAWLLVCLAAASASARGVVVCDDVRDPLTLDPHKEFSEKNHTLVQQIYEGLVRFDPDGKIEPALAVSWERVDPLKMRFHLREGVRFHDGEPFDAEAVRFSIARYLDPKTGFPAAGFLGSFDHAEVVDGRTVDLVTKFPDGLLLNRLAGFVLIVPPGYLKEKGEAALAEHPIGTGPFRFDQWLKGDRIDLTANKDYWGKGQVGLDSLTFRFLPESKQVQALLEGTVDLVTELPGTATSRVAADGNTKVVKLPTFYAVAGAFNAEAGPLSDVRVRRAINLAVNREDLIRYDLLGNGRPLATTTMKGEEGHVDSLEDYPFDVKRAKELLAEAGYPRGFRMKVAGKAQGDRALRVISQQLKAVGIKIDRHMYSDAEMMKALAEGGWDMVFGGCPDPMAHSFFIQSIFLYSGSPYSVYKNAKYDELLQKMVSSIDPAERERHAEELDRLIYDDVLVLPGYQRIKTYGVRRGVDFVPSVTGMPHFFRMRLRTADEGTHPQLAIP